MVPWSAPLAAARATDAIRIAATLASLQTRMTCMATAVTPTSGNAFEWLIAPLGVTEFERDYYERKTCLVQREATDYYRRLLLWDDLDTVLCTHAVTPPEIDLVKGGKPVPIADYVDDTGRVSPSLVAQSFEDGATIIFHHLQRRIPALAELCASIGEFFSSRMQTNVYLTPPGGEGFAPHWDTHDVFALQVTGRKLWLVHDTKIALPMRGQTFDSTNHEAGDITSMLEVDAGSMVYIPRGLIHSAKAGKEASLHITLGVTVFTWADFFLECVAATALENEELRRSLPCRFAADRGEFYGEYHQQFRRMKNAFAAEKVLDYLTERVRSANSPLRSGMLRDSRVE